MELSEKQLFELKKYAKIGMLEYLENSISNAKTVINNAKTEEDMKKAEQYIINSIDNYEFYSKQLEPNTYFENRQK